MIGTKGQWVVIGIAVLLAAGAGAAEPSSLPPDENLKIPLWYESASVRSGFGYKDNVLLSQSGNARGSAFWTAGGDLMAYRLPSAGWQFNCLGSFDHVGYLDRSVGVGAEQVGMAMAQAIGNLGRDWKLGMGVNYFYQNQVFDLSVTETNQAAISQVLGHNLTGRWFARKDFKPYWLEAEMSLTRQWLAAPLDGFWQLGPRLTAGRTLRPGSDLTFTYQWSWVELDHRELVTADGYLQPGTRLRFQPQSAELAWHQVWDAKARWHTYTKAGYDVNEDNGSGYFNFHQYRLAEQFKYRARTWELSAQLRFGTYDFPIQPVSATDPSKRDKRIWGASVRAEKSLGKSIKLFATYAYDRSISNVGYDQYHVSTTSVGAECHF